MTSIVLNFVIREGANVDDAYERFTTELRETLANHPERENYITRYGEWLRGHPLLPLQLAIQPERWIHINLILQDEGGMEETRITLAVRGDNVFFQGFMNQLNGQDKWYEFGKEGQSTHFFQGSTLLGCDLGYTDLVGGSANLVRLDLTKYDMIHTIRVLSVYQQDGPADGVTKHHLARLCVIICESARMTPHHDNVVFNWNSSGQSRITPQHAENVEDWSKMSRELLSDPHPEGNTYLNVVHLVLNTRPRHPHLDQQGQTAGEGGGVRTQPLVEVFSVEACFGVISNIVVFDGKRGQIIYKHGHQSQDLNHGDKLALTGPYKAISADGSFAVQVSGIASGSDAAEESTKVIGEMLWDCYANNFEYNEVLHGPIGSPPLVTVEYAVFSEAVEATVEVKLHLPGKTSAYGRISASYPEFQFKEVVLFERQRGEKLELTPSAADSMAPLELRRSVIVVPLLSHDSQVEIHVRLHVASPGQDGDVLLQGFILFLVDKNTGEIRVEEHEDLFVAIDWTRGASTSAISQGTEQTIEQQVKVQVNITSHGFRFSPLAPEDHEEIGM